ncbi:MAG TPA: DUF58 domain-containing protein [Flavobacteriales bacterium]
MESPQKISAPESFRLTQRFFILASIAIAGFALSFPFAFLEPLVITYCLVLLATTIADFVLLFIQKPKLTAQRSMTKMLSLGDDNTIELHLTNESNLYLNLELYDELPFQFQERNFKITTSLAAHESTSLHYIVRPLKRGEYDFGFLNAITSTRLGVVARRMQLAEPQMTPVYPSLIQMKKYELIAFAKISTSDGIRRLRRVGHTYEFEKIKTYAQGDDIRSINWKATGRRNQLMVNQYEDERSQQIYCIIDKSRVMHMPFNGLSLLDYAVNSSLVISNIALKKYDKAGLITFSHAIGSTLRAERSEHQLKKIMNALYHEKPQPYEANYDLMYQGIKNVIRSRSLLFLNTNFESTYAMERALPVLQKINRLHLLVVIIFENTELSTYATKQPEYVSDIYAQTIAQKLLNDKKQIVARLHKYGIQTILSKPEDLSINTVNKYLELKARGLI